MKASVFTWEYPPAIYGGAGVHAKYITTALAKRIKVEVRTLEVGPKPEIEGVNVLRYQPTLRGLATGDPRILKALQVLSFNMNMVADPIDAAIVHTHTWYTNFAGAMAKRIYGAKLVATVHSLEPLRPWKREQLGAGYEMSLWMEREGLLACDAVIAVSRDMKADIQKAYPIPASKVAVIHNGVDPQKYYPRDGVESLAKFSIRTPFVFFVGRLSRQKGIFDLLHAMACETPVIATRVGGIKEVVVDEETGLLVPPGEPAKLGRAITRIIEDPATGEKMGKAGRRLVLEQFTWDQIAAKTLELYRSLT